MYLKERLLIYGIILLSGVGCSLYTFWQDEYDKWVFILSLAILCTFPLTGYVILFGEDNRDLISQDKLANVSKAETIRKLFIGFNPKARIVAIIGISGLLLISYWNIVPAYTDNVELKASFYISETTNSLVIEYKILNNGSRPVYVLIPTFRYSLTLTMKDSNGGKFHDEDSYHYQPSLPTSSSRKRLEGGESIGNEIWFYYLSNSSWDNYLNLSYEYGIDFETYQSDRYWTYNTTPPYTISLIYDTSEISYRYNIWRGQIEVTTSDFVIP